MSLTKSGFPCLRVSIVRGGSALEQLYRYIVFLTVENCVGSITEDLINELVTESLPDVGGGPEQANWDTTLEDGVRTRADTGTSGHEDHAAEHGGNPEDTVGRKATNPELGRWVLNDISSPVTSAGNDEGELVLFGLGDGGESVPFPERRMGNPNGRACIRAGY